MHFRIVFNKDRCPVGSKSYSRIMQLLLKQNSSHSTQKLWLNWKSLLICI